MGHSAMPSTPVLHPQAEESASKARLSGWRLLVARTAAFSVIGVTVLLGIVALVNWRRLATPCSNALNTCLMSPEQVAPLARLGITPTGLALGVVLICCAAIALTNVVAALLLWRRSDDAMALLVAVTLVLLPAFFTPMYQALSGPWAVASEVVRGVAGISFLLLVLLFPSGRFEPRWIRVPVLAGVVFIFFLGGRLPNAVVVPGILVWALTLIGGQIYRYRQISSPVQRQQTKWAVTGIVLAIAVNQLFWQPEGLVSALQRKDSLYPLLVYPDFVVLIAVLAACFGVAILRYRLYDIDLIIRRTLIYGTLTAVLAGTYFVVVLGVQTLVRDLTGQTGQQPIVIVATTLLVAALVMPLRHHIQAGIDRAFYRNRYDAAQTLRAFNAKMRTETDMEELREYLMEAVHQTVHPAHISLWLRAPKSALPTNVSEASASRGDRS